MAPITFYHKCFTGKKRKSSAAAHSEVTQKKVKLDKSTLCVRKGTECPSKANVSGGAAASCNGCAYFASRFKIHEFEVASKNWTKIIDCPYESFGLVSKENELIVVGGLDNSKTPTNKVLCFSLKKKEWEEYPPMSIARISPQVVVADKYLIVLGGKVEENSKIKTCVSVEIFDFEAKCWFSNESLSLPEEKVPDLRWLSACVCGKVLYVAARHFDPEYSSTMDTFVYDRDDDSDCSEHDYSLDPDPYPCYSLFRCSLDALQAIQEGEKVEVWQKMEYPHPSVYNNPPCDLVNLSVFVDYNNKCNEAFIDGEEPPNGDMLQTNCFCYNVCCFTLSCIDDRLFAVGCKHVESISHETLRKSLKYAYASYREVVKDNRGTYSVTFIDTDGDDHTVDNECYIYEFCTDSDSWKFNGSTPDNGTSDETPSVASVNGSLVIMRNSKTLHIVDFS